MSFTETIYSHSPSTRGTPTIPTSTLPYMANTNEQENKGGLAMKIDNKISETLVVRPLQTSGAGKSPVTSQFCGMTSSLSGWILRSAMCFQKAHSSTLAFALNMNELIQKKAVRILTIFLYMSLLVLGIQSVAIIVLLTQSTLSLGIYFLISCISILGWVFWSLAEITEPTTYPKYKLI